MFPDTTNLIKKVETYKYQKSVISVAFLGHCRNYGGDIGYWGVLNFMPCLDSDIPDLVCEDVVEFQLVICDSICQIWTQMNQVVELVLQNAGI